MRILFFIVVAGLIVWMIASLRGSKKAPTTGSWISRSRTGSASSG